MPRYPDYTPKYAPLDDFKAWVQYLNWLNRIRRRVLTAPPLEPTTPTPREGGDPQ